MESSQIKMVKVSVRQKDDVDSGQLVEFECGRGQSFRTDGESRQSNPDARKKYRIGENVYAEKINKHSCVTDPGRGYSGIIPFRRLGFGKSRGNRPPAFDRPLPPKVPEPTAHARAAQSRLFRC